MKISKKVKRSVAVPALCLLSAVAALIAAELVQQRFPALDADFILYAVAAIACFFAFRRMRNGRPRGTEEAAAPPSNRDSDTEDASSSPRAPKDLRAAIRRRKEEARQSHETK